MKKLSQLLTDFVSTLSASQKPLFKELCNEWAQSHYEFGEVFKLQAIDLIPSKIGQQPDKDGFYGKVIDDGTRVDPRSVLPTFDGTKFVPSSKKKGDPLQELAAGMSSTQREELIAKLQKEIK